MDSRRIGRMRAEEFGRSRALFFYSHPFPEIDSITACIDRRFRDGSNRIFRRLSALVHQPLQCSCNSKRISIPLS